MKDQDLGVQRFDSVLEGASIALPAVASVADLITFQAQAAPRALAVRHATQIRLDGLYRRE